MPCHTRFANMKQHYVQCVGYLKVQDFGPILGDIYHIHICMYSVIYIYICIYIYMYLCMAAHDVLHQPFKDLVHVKPRRC